MAAKLQNVSLIHRQARSAPDFLPQDIFRRMLFLERKRTERSERGFVLMLLRSRELLKDQAAFNQVLSALVTSTRDTDTKGWYQEHSTIGMIFTELGAHADGRTVANALLLKVTKALSQTLSLAQINQIGLSFYVFPEKWDGGSPADESDSRIYHDLLRDPADRVASRLIKRSMDIVGSLFALILFLPLFLLIALAVKLTSRGPVLFRQERLGQFGKKFNFLKFRSMYFACDDTVHRDYVRRFIANDGTCRQSQDSQSPYKLTADKRVTSIGHFLRKTSLDELPQFLNVLKGEMSLVGPRPPVPYEVECYQVWHKTRLLAAKPGITGLWQIGGRSRVEFDDMVRMDLRYASSWSVWLDIKILLQTPYAVFSGTGAH
jgi:lipopolysaccharide/colanic/teichoic acid biosynthesis glycosyltransferase